MNALRVLTRTPCRYPLCQSEQYLGYCTVPDHDLAGKLEPAITHDSRALDMPEVHQVSIAHMPRPSVAHEINLSG